VVHASANVFLGSVGPSGAGNMEYPEEGVLFRMSLYAFRLQRSYLARLLSPWSYQIFSLAERPSVRLGLDLVLDAGVLPRTVLPEA